MEERKTKKPESYRIMGVELGGSKSSRTSITGLEYFLPQKKIFVTYYRTHLKPEKDKTGDEALVKIIENYSPDLIGVNAPLSLPPFFENTKAKTKTKGNYGGKDSIRWMENEAKKQKLPAQKAPTPYTQRPIDIFLRTRMQPLFSMDLQIEETLGSARAPLAARMQYLQSILSEYNFLETHPRLTLLTLSRWFTIGRREIRRYKDLESGLSCRLQILEAMEKDLRKYEIPQLFLYELDKITISKNLDLFYSFLNALMAAYSKSNLLLKPEKDFQEDWGFIAIPKDLKEIKKKCKEK